MPKMLRQVKTIVQVFLLLSHTWSTALFASLNCPFERASGGPICPICFSWHIVLFSPFFRWMIGDSLKKLSAVRGYLWESARRRFLTGADGIEDGRVYRLRAGTVHYGRRCPRFSFPLRIWISVLTLLNVACPFHLFCLFVGNNNNLPVVLPFSL